MGRRSQGLGYLGEYLVYVDGDAWLQCRKTQSGLASTEALGSRAAYPWSLFVKPRRILKARHPDILVCSCHARNSRPTSRVAGRRWSAP